MAKGLVTGGIAVASSSKKEKKTAKATRGGRMNPKKSKPKAKSTHPPTSSMVNSAIESLKERSGSSLPAIKKYLVANYNVNVEKLAPFIKKYLRSAVARGKLVQTKGTGASGSFKLPISEKKSSPSPKPKADLAKRPAGEPTNSAANKLGGIQNKKPKSRGKETPEPDATKKTASKKPAAKK